MEIELYEMEDFAERSGLELESVKRHRKNSVEEFEREMRNL